ncbi:MAG: glycoside hydrolase family 30 protein [Bacteroidales bacterium]|nr:glycoside hydrolase family 30 protein [Bacteroidales bacterium]
MRKKINYLIFIFILFSACIQKEKSKKQEGDKKHFNSAALKQADLYITAFNTSYRLTKKESLKFENLEQPDESFPTIIIDPDKKFQEIEGFGGALTDAAAETFYKLPGSKQEELVKKYFSAENGIGYTLCRTHINSCDFSSESYAYCDVKGDTSLKSFSISHDKKFRIPFIKKAIAESQNKINIFASPWSPPAWMKTNNDMLHGGKLKPEYYQAWANYFVKFIKEYEKAGIAIWGLTVQNEPAAVQTWESCIYTAKEECGFIKNCLGPTLEKAGLSDKKIMIWDHNRGIMYQRAKEVYDDAEASKYVWGMAYHWYVGDHFENVRLVNDAYPEKKLLFTEGCVYPFEWSKINEWHWGETYGKSIINDLNNFATGWVDWNILLDEKGGPNHVGNYCYAPVIADSRTGELHYMNSFYYIGHFSKFIKPGARRIICCSNNDELLATAFINTDGKIAVVVMNTTDKNIDFKIRIDEKAAGTKSLAHSIATIVLY